jgi:hypothetical protein
VNLFCFSALALLIETLADSYLAHIGYRKWDTVSWGMESLTLTPNVSSNSRFASHIN